MKPASVVRCGIVAGGLAVTAAIGPYASTAFAAAQPVHSNGSIPAGTPFDLGRSPSPLPDSCPFNNGDANFVFLSGSFVSHDTPNNNGDWGGFTAQGTAEFLEDGTPIEQGHLTIWEGGGNNSPTRGQGEGGMTVDFTGSDVQIHVNAHGTIPANSSTGLPTADVLNVTVTCA